MLSHSQFAKSITAAPQDVSLPVFQELLGQGYDSVLWRTNPGATDGPCLVRNGDTFPLADFISGLQYAAPIYEKTHVGCKCQMVVSGPGLPEVIVTAFGRE
jgi:hypothetical protein